MHCIDGYATGMCLYLSTISSEIQIFNFWYLSSVHSVLLLEGCKDPWLFFYAKRGPWAKTFL